ncbi:hypothetical protein [Streptomyces sp. enrichment culture]|uniref:hypothetical protein n=1 Tax=Streptomyces sp. enrichment culture TaxID=1795815 RepID=UPI003F56D226
MTRDDGTVWDEAEVREATLEIQQALAARFRGRPLPPDLVITTRSEIEKREFTAYAHGWQDRGEHDARRRAEARAKTEPEPQPHRSQPPAAKILPFPDPSDTTSARPHPDDERH